MNRTPIFLTMVLLILPFLLMSEKYYGPINFTEKRIQDLKQELSMNSTKNELEISLFYKGKYSDYVVFYDLSGEEIYYKYRRNKFDIRAERRVISLVPGYAYRVNGNFIGMYIYKNKAENKLNPIPVYLKKTDVQKENILEKNNTPVLNFIFAKPIFLNQLIY